jgi:hypothetical protein
MRRGGSAALAAALLAGLAALTTAGAGAAPATRTEQAVHSAAPDAKLVSESYVRVKAPLPSSAGDHPEACDWLSYLRFRDPHGPRSSSKADAIVTAMPGFLSGAAPLDQLARNFVRKMSDRGLHAEFWAIDRRANCLEDHTGIAAAARAHDPKVAYDYYWGGKAINGHTFSGWKTASQTQWLSHMGLDQTVRDWYSVITKEIPNRSTRRKKLFCGGHSLGGPITAAFAGWDFDGNPSTTTDAGYEQCAGFYGLDTTLDAGESSSSPGASQAIEAGSAGAPFVGAPPFTPETLEIPDVFGLGAFFQPQKTNVIADLPHTSNIDLSQRVLFSRDAANFATGSPSIRDFHLTNEVALAGVFDDNSEPITILRASLGTTAGGPVAQKNFPGVSSPLTNNDFTMIPSDTKTPLYRWVPYNKMAQAPKQLNDAGQAYTSAKSEKTDLHQFARSTFEAPADFAEQYFPTRLFVDSIDAGDGDRSGSLANFRYDGVPKRPAQLIEAGDSASNSGANPRTTPRASAPNKNRLSGAVTLPGYNHIDVTAAAWRQNDGRPEGSSKALSDFTCRVLGDCARSCLAKRAPMGKRNLGRVRLGRTRRTLGRLPGFLRRTRHSYRFCVKGGVGSVSAAFSRRGKAQLVTTTAPGHSKRHIHPGSRSSRFRRAFRHRVLIRRGLYRAGRHSRLLIGVRRGRVRYLGVASATLLRHPRTLRRYLRYAGAR